jgi:hypothetical protein
MRSRITCQRIEESESSSSHWITDLSAVGTCRPDVSLVISCFILTVATTRVA